MMVLTYVKETDGFFTRIIAKISAAPSFNTLISRIKNLSAETNILYFNSANGQYTLVINRRRLFIFDIILVFATAVTVTVVAIL